MKRTGSSPQRLEEKNRTNLKRTKYIPLLNLNTDHLSKASEQIRATTFLKIFFPYGVP